MEPKNVFTLVPPPSEEEPTWRTDIPLTLRNIADRIEAGEFGEVLDIVLVTHGAQLEVFHAGVGDVGTAHILLACGQQRLQIPVLREVGLVE